MIESLVALFVTDDIAYQNYRAGMTPILQTYGGGFGYDFKVSDVLKSEADKPINRVFTIYFPDEATMQTFFNDPDYLAVRDQYFAPSVTTIINIAQYKRATD